jgi:hypothetical protein
MKINCPFLKLVETVQIILTSNYSAGIQKQQMENNPDRPHKRLLYVTSKSIPSSNYQYSDRNIAVQYNQKMSSE